MSSAIGLLQFFGVSGSFKPWVNVTGLGDAFGNLRQRNQFATLIGIGLAVLLWGPVARWRLGGRGAASIGRALPVALPLLLAVALLATADAISSSRTGLLQLVVLVLLAMCWRTQAVPGMALRLGLAVSVYAGASVMLPLLAGLDPWSSGIAGRFGDTDRVCGSRRLLWANVLQLIAQKPWGGWGWGELDYAHFINVYTGARFCDILDNAHNLPLHLAVELGVPVALLACALIAWLVLRARPWQETDDGRRLAWSVLALVGLHSLLEYPLWYGPFQIAVVLAAWILWRRSPSADSGQPMADTCGSVSTAMVTSGRVLAVAALLAVAYAAWQYHRVSQVYLAPALRAPAYRDNTLAKVQDSWLFRNQIRFAALTLTGVTPDNAASINRSAHALLHFSPEARVVQKLIDSALVLGDTDQAVFYMRRMRIAYPKEYAHWRETREPVAELPAIDP
ncbi:Wzy polymerase domain-containing protein [Comamonadaceae bacterium G21597-S1]|nr:Wzy polymerase domain-containing protein [Comamonadaceae bacterium G21597-S1]